MLEKYTYKVFVAGDVTEVYQYHMPQYREIDKQKVDISSIVAEIDEKIENFEQKDEKMKKIIVENENKKRRIENINRTKKNIKRLINANVNQYATTDKFLTLTFPNKDGKEPSREWVLYRFKEFKKKMYKKYGKFEYIAVIERGSTSTERLHLHVVCFGLKFIRQAELQKVWGGIVDIRKISEIPNSLNGVADYMTKYIQKTLEDGEYIERYKKFYFASTGLKKYKEVLLTDDEIEDYLSDLGMQTAHITFKSEYVGTCTYSRYVKQQDIYELGYE